MAKQNTPGACGATIASQGETALVVVPVVDLNHGRGVEAGIL
jgi:hypothetical protein